MATPTIHAKLKQVKFKMSSLAPEYNIKMKLAQSYQEDLVAQKAKFDLEKQKRIEQ